MKVQEVQIDGTASGWARKWYDDAPVTFTAYQGEGWALRKLPEALPGLRSTRHDCAHRLVDRLIQKGRKDGLWFYDGGSWQIEGRDETPPPGDLRYCIVSDDSGHHYFCPVELAPKARDVFDSIEEFWSSGSTGNAPTEPRFVTRIDGTFTFTDPRGAP